MDSKFYEPEVLKQLQGEILSILDDFIRICEDYHLEYFGIAGTGIGALRHKGFIPWDDDIDIAMPRRDFEHLLRIVEKKMSDRYLVLNAERYPNYPLMTTRLVKKGTVRSVSFWICMCLTMWRTTRFYIRFSRGRHGSGVS